MIARFKNKVTEAIKHRKFSLLIFGVALLILPFSMNYSTMLLLAAIVLKFLQAAFQKDQNLFDSKTLKHSSIIGLIIVVYIISNAIFQNGFYNTMMVFEREYAHYLLFIFIPVVLSDKKTNSILFFLFTVGTLIASVYILSYFWYNQEVLSRFNLMQAVDIHHSYLCAFLLVITNKMFVSTITDKANLKRNVILTLIFSVLTIYIVYKLESKMSLIIFILLLVYYLFISKAFKRKPIYLTALGIIIVLAAWYNQEIIDNYKRAVDFRQHIWHESFNIFEQNMWFGKSTATEKELLNYNHYVKGNYAYLDSDLGSHNQYLSILMKYGLFGFFFFLLPLILAFRTVNKNTSIKSIKETIGFVIITALFFYIENMFDRHHGVVFITCFYNYYLIALKND